MANSPGLTMPPPPPGGAETILLAEDDVLIARSTARILERHGYCVLRTADGVDALDVFERNKAAVELVLLDIEMPKMGGLECMRHLLKRDPDLKIIVLSGHLLTQRAWDPVEDGARAFVEKPFIGTALLSVIRSVLDGDPGVPAHDVTLP
jgi:two-component system cell cycle sensor histidine kinase/response regulator CckA